MPPPRSVSLTGGGVDHAFEVVGASAATIRLAWDALRSGGTAVVVGLAPAGVEVALPAIEFLSEKRSSAATTAPRTRRCRCAAWSIWSAGRLQLDDMVSHLIELDQIPEAFERLRRGEGDRSVVVIDPELAGVDAT